MDTLIISERDAGVTLIEPVRDSEGFLDSFSVLIVDDGLRAEARVDAYGIGPGPESFFRSLAECWRGWEGEKEWQSLSRELTLIATSDALGHVKVRVELRSTSSFDSWEVVAYAHLEAGQLESLSARAGRFFGREL